MCVYIYIYIYIYIHTANLPLFHDSIPAFGFAHFVITSQFQLFLYKDETCTGEFSDPLSQSASLRFTPFPPVTATEHQASLLLPLCSISHKFSTTPRLNLAFIVKTFNFFPDILESFGHANISSNQKLDSFQACGKCCLIPTNYSRGG